jgi:hypothetical protein
VLPLLKTPRRPALHPRHPQVRDQVFLEVEGVVVEVAVMIAHHAVVVVVVAVRAAEVAAVSAGRSRDPLLRVARRHRVQRLHHVVA